MSDIDIYAAILLVMFVIMVIEITMQDYILPFIKWMKTNKTDMKQLEQYLDQVGITYRIEKPWTVSDYREYDLNYDVYDELIQLRKVGTYHVIFNYKGTYIKDYFENNVKYKES